MNNTHFDGDASIGRHLAIGGDASVSGSVVVGHNLRVGGWLDAPNIRGAIRGFYESVEQLRQSNPSPQDGWIAAVGISNPFMAYTAQDGQWRPMEDQNGQIGTVNISLDMARLERVEHAVARLDGVAEELNQTLGGIESRMADLEAAPPSWQPWRGKVLVTWGDQVTALSNGNASRPFVGDSWINMTASALGLARHHGRSVPDALWHWDDRQGVTAFVSEDGTYVGSAPGQPEDYAGAMAAGAVTPCRGYGCSWDRMTKMIPASLRADIDCVVMMFHDDVSLSDEPLQWVERSTADVEWSMSPEYVAYGGDYNIGTVRGAIASTVMKMQTLLPNARLVLCTPLSGGGRTGTIDCLLRDPELEALAEIVRQMGRALSVPVIDIYGTCGINGLNRPAYISDSQPPVNDAGQQRLSHALTQGLLRV